MALARRSQAYAVRLEDGVLVTLVGRDTLARELRLKESSVVVYLSRGGTFEHRTDVGLATVSRLGTPEDPEAHDTAPGCLARLHAAAHVDVKRRGRRAAPQAAEAPDA